ncbi:hypothetical protein V8G54_016345 [Vigna mungo]|uniref:Uncharacterized protein n=1 Tax=Vigna mungo TaxID=3915 RepID=A0AAQ3NMS9_VIGMU
MRFPLISRGPLPFLSATFLKFKSASSCTRVCHMAASPSNDAVRNDAPSASPSNDAVRNGAPSASSVINFLSLCQNLKTETGKAWATEIVSRRKNSFNITDRPRPSR